MQYRLSDKDRFMILASDGVWEFMESQEAVEIVHLNLEKGAEQACKILIETATERWAEEEGDYRDDVSILTTSILPTTIYMYKLIRNNYRFSSSDYRNCCAISASDN